MRLINKKNLMFLTSILLVIISILFLKQTKPVELDEVKLLEASNNTSFAMYKEDGDIYTEVEGNTFPEGYVLNINKSKCIDNNGNEIRDVLSYEDNQVKLTSNKTSYCYLYFDESLGLEIKNINSNGLKTDKIRGDMYRYQGQQADNIENYICFGTSDKQTCLDHPDQYMYRIIGIEVKTGRVKVIKKEALNKYYKWSENYTDDVKLPETSFFKSINGNDFLENEEYISNDWREKIANNVWHYGDILEDEQTGTVQSIPILYEIETGQRETKWFIRENNTEMKGKWDDFIESKVGLVYLHDYSYSVGDESKCNSWNGGEEEYSKCKTGWMHITQNDLDYYNKEDLTMDRYGWNSSRNGYDCFSLSSAGFSGYWNFTVNRIVRPVFYIDASQTLKDGTGKIEDPFIIN